MAINTPGVYVVEKSLFPPSVAQVETAVPAFIGYTEKAMEYKSGDLLLTPKKITSLKEFEKFFGFGPPTSVVSVTLNENNEVIETIFNQAYYLYDSMKMFFSNGGGKCYIISVGNYTDSITQSDFDTGLDVLAKKDEPTLIVFPDAVSLSPATNIYNVQIKALAQCGELMDRFVVMDLINYLNPSIADDTTNFDKSNDEFKNKIGMSDLKFGAAYTPWIKASIAKDFTYPDIFNKLKKNSAAIRFLSNPTVASDLTKLLPAADQTFINAKFTKYDQLITDKATIMARYTTQYGATYNLKAGYNTLLGDFKDKATAAVPNMANIRTAYKLLHREALLLVDFIDDISDPTVSVDPDLNSAFDKVCDGIVEELAKLVILNNTIGNDSNLTNVPPDLIGEPAGAAADGYPTQMSSFSAQFDNIIVAELGTNNAWSHFGVASLSESIALDPGVAANKDEAGLFLHTAAAITAAPAADKDRMRRENMIHTEKFITSAFYVFYNALNTMYEKLDNLMLKIEDELIASYPLYKNIVTAVNSTPTLMPPSGAVVGRYAYVDSTRGVWKAPANVSLSNVADMAYHVSDKEQGPLNIDTESGKSINIIRYFTGKGNLIWGARTLAGNDNEWRYVSVRRFFNMVEESCKKSTGWAVFEPNDSGTWIKVKGMIDNFLILQWRAGALQGAKPEEAFFVKVGLGETMTSLDILEGRMNVEIGMAVVRPAEFIILTFSHKLATS